MLRFKSRLYYKWKRATEYSFYKTSRYENVVSNFQSCEKILQSLQSNAMEKT